MRSAHEFRADEGDITMVAIHSRGRHFPTPVFENVFESFGSPQINILRLSTFDLDCSG